jgi:hypothetical protein
MHRKENARNNSTERKDNHMKQRLFLLLSSILLTGMGTAHASCVVRFDFPDPNQANIVVPKGTCIVNRTDNPQAHLRWDNNGDGTLTLWDSDESGGAIVAWCAHDSSGNCAVGSQLCAQADGNLVIYKDLTGTCKGTPVWASNTVGQNIGGEVLLVIDNLDSNVGERAVLANNDDTGPDNFFWHSSNTDFI